MVNPLQAQELEKCTSLEFAAEVNDALGQTDSLPAAPLTTAMRGWLSGSSGGSRGGGTDFQRPPLVTGYAGGPPRSFPLQLCHAGR